MPELERTEYAPAKRYSREEIKGQQENFGNIVDIRRFLDAVSDIYFILNDNRQVVWANKAVETVTLLSKRDRDCIIFSVHNPANDHRKYSFGFSGVLLRQKAPEKRHRHNSMIPFAEKYPDGNVSFSSDEQKGIFFYGKFPINPSIKDG